MSQCSLLAELERKLIQRVMTIGYAARTLTNVLFISQLAIIYMAHLFYNSWKVHPKNERLFVTLICTFSRYKYRGLDNVLNSSNCV